MIKILISFAMLALIGCTTTANKSGEQFYTWVDASGQIRSTQRPTEKKSSSPVVIDEEAGDSKGRPAFDASSYSSSEIIDKQLDKTTTFSWQENGRVINEERTLQKKESTPLSVHTSVVPIASPKPIDYSLLLEQTVFNWPQLKGRELDLFKTYIFNTQLNVDSILIDMKRSDIATAVMFSSYVKQKKIALPNVVFLDDRLNAISSPVTPFTHYVAESWSSLAYMQGVIELPKNASYMLLLPSIETGLIELGAGTVKRSDQGYIMFKTYAPERPPKRF